MTKARDIADFKFENITDTGTEGTKVALGTTAQRGSTQGQFRFNSTTGLAEYYTGTDFKIIDSPPAITSISPTSVLTGNANITINGSGFGSGAVVKFIGTDGTEFTSPSVTVNSGSQITAQTPSSPLVVSKEPYDIKVINVSGLSGQIDDVLDAGGSPTWSTASGSLGNVTEGASVNLSISASDPDGTAITYSDTTGNLSSNSLTLNSSSGAITGTAPTVSADTTISFTGRASDGVNTTDRAFNIIIKNQTVTTLDIFSDSSCLGLYQLNNSYNNASGGSLPNLSNTSTSFTTTAKYGSHGVDMFGDSKYMDINTSTRLYCISAWSYQTSSHINRGSNGEYFFEMRHDAPSNGRPYLYFHESSQSGKKGFISYTTDTTASNSTDGFGLGAVYINGTKFTSGEFHFDLNTWYHILVQAEGSGYQSTTKSNWNQGLRFGNRSDGSTGGNSCFIDQIRVFNRILTQSEITTLANEVA
jgi:hypothetical protein